MHLIGRRDGIITGPSMEPNYPDGSEYYIKPLDGKLRLGIVVLIVAKPNWFKCHDKQIDFIVKRIDQINVRHSVIISYDSSDLSSS